MKVELDGEGQHVEIHFRPNSHGRLAYAEMRVTAPNFREAESFAFDLVSPLLSRWSFEHDAAIDVVAHVITEDMTQSVRLHTGVIGQTKMMADCGMLSSPELRMLLSPYRDGIGSTNVFFQVLSFYKVIEGVFHLRHRRMSAAKAAGQSNTRQEHERFPCNAEAFPEFDRGAFSRFLGNRFTAVRDHLKPLYRHAIAHLDPNQNVLVADRYADTSSCIEILPVLRYMAKTMLETEIRQAPAPQ